MPQCWSSNWTAQAIAWTNYLEVPISSFSRQSLVFAIFPNNNAYLCQSETTGCSFHTGEFVPQRLRHVLCHQGVRRLDLGEGFAHGDGAGCTAVEIEGEGKEKAALKEEQLEEPAPGTPEAEAHFGLVGLY